MMSLADAGRRWCSHDTGQRRAYSEGDWAVKLELRHRRRRLRRITLGFEISSFRARSRGGWRALERCGARVPL